MPVFSATTHCSPHSRPRFAAALAAAMLLLATPAAQAGDSGGGEGGRGPRVVDDAPWRARETLKTELAQRIKDPGTGIVGLPLPEAEWSLALLKSGVPAHEIPSRLVALKADGGQVVLIRLYDGGDVDGDCVRLGNGWAMSPALFCLSAQAGQPLSRGGATPEIAIPIFRSTAGNGELVIEGAAGGLGNGITAALQHNGGTLSLPPFAVGDRLVLPIRAPARGTAAAEKPARAAENPRPGK